MKNAIGKELSKIPMPVGSKLWSLLLQQVVVTVVAVVFVDVVDVVVGGGGCDVMNAIG